MGRSGDGYVPEMEDGNEAARTPAVRHRALLAGSPDEVDEGVAAFVAEGVDAGAGLLLAMSDGARARLRALVGPALDEAAVLETARLYSSPAWTLARLRREIEGRTAAGRPLRIVGAPDWFDRPVAEREVWMSADAVANVAFTPSAAAPVELLCAYDTSAAPPDVVTAVPRTHPEVVEAGRTSRSGAYTDPALYCTRHRDRPLPPLPEPVEVHEFDAATLAPLRRAVADAASAADVDPRRVPEVVLVVNEAATNSVRHAGGSGIVRLAVTPEHLVCDVVDTGVITAPFAGLLPPERTGDGGYGLWLVHQLCDLVQVRSGPAGTTMRMHVRRGPVEDPAG
jgi:anti-sigma regulatory factor (Ser/Thr protein kinase)